MEAITNLYTDPDGRLPDDGLRSMAVFLMAARHTKEMYADKCIDENIYIDSMGFFKRQIDQNVLRHGRAFFSGASWFHRQLSLTLFRLGTLEFEMTTLTDAVYAGFPGETDIPVLSVHIPPDAIFTREELDKCYDAAFEFFPRYFPDFKFRNIFCSTWLLAPVLKELLPPGSGILNFQSDYAITKVNYDYDGNIMHWVFKTDDKNPDINALPEDTSLCRALKKHLLAGGAVYSAAGVIYRKPAIRDRGPV